MLFTKRRSTFGKNALQSPKAVWKQFPCLPLARKWQKAASLIVCALPGALVTPFKVTKSPRALRAEVQGNIAMKGAAHDHRREECRSAYASFFTHLPQIFPFQGRSVKFSAICSGARRTVAGSSKVTQHSAKGAWGRTWLVFSMPPPLSRSVSSGFLVCTAC